MPFGACQLKYPVQDRELCIYKHQTSRSVILSQNALKTADAVVSTKCEAPTAGCHDAVIVTKSSPVIMVSLQKRSMS